MLPAVQFPLLLLQLAFPGLDIVLPVAEFVVLLAHERLVLALHLEEFLLGLQDLLLLDVLGLEIRLFDDGVGASRGRGAADQYINCKGQYGSGNGC